MNKEEFNKVVREVLTKHQRNSNIDEANAFINVFTDSVIEALKENDEIQLVGFGKFSKRKVKAHKGRHPQTGKVLDIPASFQVRFVSGKNLKDAVNLPPKAQAKKKEKK